jgi:hypothetical protein
MKIYVTRPIPEAGLNILREAQLNFEMNMEDRVLTRPELLAKAPGREGLLTLLTANCSTPPDRNSKSSPTTLWVLTTSICKQRQRGVC